MEQPPDHGKGGANPVIPLFGLKYSRVLRFSGLLGIGVGVEEPKGQWKGLVALAEAGQGGMTAQLGAGARNEAAGLFGRVAYLRTWGDPRGVGPGQDYAGVEVTGMLMGFNAMVGLYHHVSGSPAEPDWLYTLGVGLWY